MPASQGFVSSIVTAKSSLGELFVACGWMRIAGGPPSTTRRLVASAIGKTLISTFAIERDSILRIKIAGFVERLTVPSQINSTASILGLNSSVGEQAATNDDVTMEPATGPET
jgi:hypothetical protein